MKTSEHINHFVLSYITFGIGPKNEAVFENSTGVKIMQTFSDDGMKLFRKMMDEYSHVAFFTPDQVIQLLNLGKAAGFSTDQLHVFP